LATISPILKRARRLPLSRDQVMMVMIALNMFMLGVDTYLAHNISGTIRPFEWIPIIFGPIAGAVLLLAGLVAHRQRTLATVIATITLLTSTIVGGMGIFFHLMRAVLPSAPAGQQVSLSLFVWAPPILGPLMFCLVGILGLSAVWPETYPDSGILILPKNLLLQLPYSKTRAYFLIVSMAILATVISSVFDHARAHFENPWLWLPTLSGVLGAVVAATLGTINRPTRADLITYIASMLLLIVVGVVGAFLHFQTSLVREGVIVTERIIRGAPILAPLLFSDMGVLGLIVLLTPNGTE